MIGRNIARKVTRNLTHPIGLGWSLGTPAPSGEYMTLGINVAGTAGYSNLRKYIDEVITCRNFLKVGAAHGLYTNPDDYPDEMAARGPNGYPIESFTMLVRSSAAVDSYDSGIRNCSFSGTATAVTAISHCIVSNVTPDYLGSGRTYFNLEYTGENPVIEISNPSGECDIKINRPGYAWDTSEVFTENYKALARLFKLGFRYMDWTITNGSSTDAGKRLTSISQVNWADRFKSSGLYGRLEYRYSHESVVEHANYFNCNPWINIPHGASDNYISSAAAFYKANLSAGLIPRVELSNETWNNLVGFTAQNAYCKSMAKASTLWVGGSTYATDFQPTCAFVSNSTSGVDSGVAGNILTFKFANPHSVTSGTSIGWRFTSILATENKTGTAACTVIDATTLYVTVPTSEYKTVPRASTVYVYFNPASTLLATGYVDEYVLSGRWKMMRTKQISDIFYTEYGAYSAFRICYADQISGSNISDSLKWANTVYGEISTWCHDIACAAYVAPIGTETDSATAISNMRFGSHTKAIPVVAKRAARWSNLAQWYGTKFILYELGPDIADTGLTAIANAIQSDPSMSLAVKELITTWVERCCDEIWYYYADAFSPMGGSFAIADDVSAAITSEKVSGMTNMMSGQIPPVAYADRFLGTFPAFAATLQDAGANDSGWSYDIVSAINNGANGKGTSPYQLIITPAAGKPMRIPLHIECPESRNYTITPDFIINATPSTNPIQLYVDGVAYGSTFLAPLQGNPYNVVAIPAESMVVALTAGKHLLEYRSTSTTSTATIGFGKVSVV